MLSSFVAKKRLKCSLPLFSLIFFFLHAQATHFNEINSLRNTTDIVQDQHGFIWLSGPQGLSRFNGNNLTHFANNSHDWQIPFIWTNSLSQSDDKLVIGTESHGLWELDTKTGKTYHIATTIPSKTIYHAIKHDGHYYIYTVNPRSLYRFTPGSKITSSLKENVLIKDFLTLQDRLYFYNKQGVFEITATEIIPKYKGQIKLATTTQNKIVIVTNDEIVAIDTNNNAEKRKLPKNVTAISATSTLKNFYLATSRGEIKHFSESLKQLTHKYGKTQLKNVHKIYQDDSGLLWLISNQGIETLTQNFNVNHEKVFNSAKMNAIDISILNEELIIGSYGAGLHDFIGNSPVFVKDINKGLPSKALKVMDIESVADQAFVATFDGLWRYKMANNSYQKLDIGNNDQILLKLKHLDNSLYIGTDANGFIIYDLATNQVKRMVGKEQPFSSPEILDLLPLNDGTVWLATAKGVDVYNPANQSIDQITIPISSKAISLAINENKIFVATKGNGIFIYNREKELLGHIAQNKNFTYIRKLRDKIWAPSEQGLYTISPHDYRITLVPGTEDFSFSSEPVLLNDTVYAPHYGGVLEIPLTNKSKFSPKVYISKTTVSGQSYLQNKAIKVKSPNDVITLELASLDYRPGQEKDFKYQINGGSWNPVNGNQLTLTGLASGMYHIEIMATNSLGQWSTNKAFTEISVAYPWYWTPQIRIIYAVTFAGFIFMVFWLLYLRAKSIKHIHQVLSSDIKNRGKVALTISQNLNFAIELLGRDRQESEEKLQATKLLQQSIKELNSNLKTTEPDSLYGNSLGVALPFFCDYIHKKYHINVQSKLTIDEASLSYELQSDIYKITYEAITSAILNGDGRNFAIKIQEVKNKIWLTINDDGNSFTQFNNKINFDMAMYYIRQIANKYNATVNTYDENEAGSQLAISIPLMDIG